MGKKIDEMHRQRMAQSPAYRAEYEALEEEFSLASAVIEARKQANLTQRELAERMNTTQQAIARMEGGSMPSMRTLSRLAAATGTRLRVNFEKTA